jgi:hypothetical protein
VEYAQSRGTVQGTTNLKDVHKNHLVWLREIDLVALIYETGNLLNNVAGLDLFIVPNVVPDGILRFVVSSERS